MTENVGILAFGSLIDDPGEEIESSTVRTITGVLTPFTVEFARSSTKRKGAPTLVPVENGGSRVAAKIFVVDLTAEEAASRVYRRERNEVGSGRVYKEPNKVTRDTVLIKKLKDFAGVETVLYTHIGANIEPLTGERLAQLAIASARVLEDGRDGISYLINAKENGIATPLSNAYEDKIRRSMNAADLREARTLAYAQGRELLQRAVEVLVAVIRNIHLKRVVHSVDPAPRLNFWRLIYGNLLDMAVIEWCKLFGSDHEEHQPTHWRNVLPEETHNTFRQGLLRHMNFSQDDWTRYRNELKQYRDNYAAHLSVSWLRPEKEPKDARNGDRYPELGPALQACYYLYGRLLDQLAGRGIRHPYPENIEKYCDRFVAQATKAAGKAVAATAGMVESVL